MALEARGTHEASRRAENTLTGHTRLFCFLTRLYPDVYLTGVSVLMCSLCCLFFLQAVPFVFAAFCRVRSLSRLSLVRGLPAVRGLPLRRLPALHGLPPSCPSRAAWFSRAPCFLRLPGLCHSRASRPGLPALLSARGLAAHRRLPALRGLPSLFRAVSLFVLKILQSLSSSWLLVLKFSIHSFSRGLLLFVRFSSLFRAVCSLFPKSLVSFERLAPCSLIS